MKYAVVALLHAALAIAAGPPDTWVPIRWEGGPLEAARPAIATWYEPSTLDLLSGSPVNCLLLTLSGGADAAAQKEQLRLVAAYSRAARAKGLATLGVVKPGARPAEIAASAAAAGVDGVVLEGEFEGGVKFYREVEQALRAKQAGAVVIPITGPSAHPPGAWPVVAISEGVQPGIRELSDIDATPSSEPWIDSNTWLVRSVRAWSGKRPVWLSYKLDKPAPDVYPRAVADAAAAGGRWVVALDDEFRAGLRRGDAASKQAWHKLSSALRYQQEHALWRDYRFIGPLVILQDPASKHADLFGEYLNLIARRQCPYTILQRGELAAERLRGSKGVLAVDLKELRAAERKTLEDFAAQGGTLISGPAAAAGAAKGEGYATRQSGKGEIVAYPDDPPDPEAVSKDMRDLLGGDAIKVFNGPSVLTCLSSDDADKRVLVQMVAYSSAPSDRVTLRIKGEFRKARLFTPGEPPADLPAEQDSGTTEIVLQKVALWMTLLLEK